MTNREKLAQLSNEELAKYFVYVAEEPDFDDDFEGNWNQCGTTTYYANTVNHQLSWSMEDAISDVVGWLTSESVEGQIWEQEAQ